MKKKNNALIGIAVDAVMTISMLLGCLAVILKMFNFIEYGWLKVLIPFWFLIALIVSAVTYIQILKRKSKR